MLKRALLYTIWHEQKRRPSLCSSIMKVQSISIKMFPVSCVTNDGNQVHTVKNLKFLCLCDGKYAERVCKGKRSHRAKL